jgi:hypothetical protein
MLASRTFITEPKWHLLNSEITIEILWWAKTKVVHIVISNIEPNQPIVVEKVKAPDTDTAHKTPRSGIDDEGRDLQRNLEGGEVGVRAVGIAKSTAIIDNANDQKRSRSV